MWGAKKNSVADRKTIPSHAKDNTPETNFPQNGFDMVIIRYTKTQKRQRAPVPAHTQPRKPKCEKRVGSQKKQVG